MRLFRWGTALLVITFMLVLGGAFLSPSCESLTQRDKRYDVAFILGGGMGTKGRLHLSTKGRVLAGVALYNAQVVDRLHTSGGSHSLDRPSAGNQMALLAQENGVPEAAISRETRSWSTLQNGLFSVPYLADAKSIILVSEGFHLARGWLSLAWAGIPPNAVCYSNRFSQVSEDSPEGALRSLPREVIAFWYNFVRAAVHSAAVGLGAKPANMEWIIE